MAAHGFAANKALSPRMGAKTRAADSSEKWVIWEIKSTAHARMGAHVFTGACAYVRGRAHAVCVCARVYVCVCDTWVCE